MPAFAEDEIDWRLPDVTAILKSAGILSVLPTDLDVLDAWLADRNYVVHTLDFGVSFKEVQAQLGELFRWQEEFGYRLEDGTASLDALHDGFDFQATPGGRFALRVLRADAITQRDWLLGFLSIAAEHSTYHLARGSRFLTVLPLAENSPLVGAEFDRQTVVPPRPLRLSDGLPRA